MFSANIVGRGPKLETNTFTMAAPVGVTSSFWISPEKMGTPFSSSKRCRRRNGQHAMGAGHRSPANVERRTAEVIHAEGFRANGSTHDVHDGVGRSHFVEMNAFNADVVNLGFGRSQRDEDFAGRLFRVLADRRSRNDLQNFAESPGSPVAVNA